MNEALLTAGNLCFAMLGTVIAKYYLNIFLTEKEMERGAAGWLLFFLWQIYAARNISWRFPGFYMLCTLVAMGLIGAIGYTSALWKRLTFPALFVSIWQLLDLLFMLGITMLAGERDFLLRISLWASRLCLLFVVLLIAQYIKVKGAAKESMEKGIFIILPFMAAMTVYFTFFISAEQGVSPCREHLYWLFFGTVGMILLHLLVYPAYLIRVEEARIKKNQDMYIKQMNLFRQQKQLEEQETMELRTKRHDLKQKLIYIRELVKQNERDRLLAVLDQLIGDTVKKEYLEEWTGNLVVDSLVNHLYRESHKRNIRLDTRISLPKEMNIKDTDLCVLQGNAFDNAVEALECVEEEKREMWVEMKYERGCLLFYVKNRYDGNLEKETDGSLKTRKKQGIHGLGIRSMKKVAAKYNGSLLTEEKEGMFVLKAILYEPKTE
ncbi:sensor histidine kinase [Clostridium sp. HBUAS56010]|uniref:ATP-binding protein n=1 Tax=Clostridium sp. HBUAS56010 TaxID=2571127 RepID=UPI00163DADAC|nr:sensor histidine kinase [Clostridium sp. HBUAS56010]